MFIHTRAGKPSHWEQSLTIGECWCIGIDLLFTQYIQQAFRTILVSQQCPHYQDFPSFFQDFPRQNFFFYILGDNIWSSTQTLGLIFIRNTPKCSKLNCRQFEYIFIKIYLTLSHNLKKTGVYGGNPRRPHPSTYKTF